MGLFDSILGRSKPAPPDLDALFRLPGAVLGLQAALGIEATGTGSVAFRAPAGRAFDEVQSEITALLSAPDLDGSAGPKVEVTEDSYGFTWVVLHHDPQDMPGLVTDLHAANSTLADSGFGSTLLCSLVALRAPDGRRVALIYLFKQGTFYPFVPQAGSDQQRDSVLELQMRDIVQEELPVEPTLSRWFAVWGAPGL
jgi:hypothetical protein